MSKNHKLLIPISFSTKGFSAHNTNQTKEQSLLFLYICNDKLWVISSYSPEGKPHTILENQNIATLKYVVVSFCTKKMSLAIGGDCCIKK